MSANIDKIKDRIRKLFNLAANDAAADGEISNALKAARELMLAHQLSEDDVNAEPEDLRTPEQVAADTEYGTAKSWSTKDKVPAWQGLLGHAVAEFIGTVKHYRDHAKVRHNERGFVMDDGRRVSGWVFYGPADDVALAAELHQELIFTCATAAKLRFGGELMKGPGRDYCDGFAEGLYEKVKEAKRAVDREQQATAVAGRLDGQQYGALAVVRAGNIALAKKIKADAWLKQEKGIHLRSVSRKSRWVGDSGAYGQGRTDGRSQGLSKSRLPRLCG